MGKSIFEKLRKLDIYDFNGERLKSLSELSEDEINTLLEDTSKHRMVCPLCQAILGSANDEDSLIQHLENHHNQGDPDDPGSPDNPDDGQTPSQPGGDPFKFTASEGWVRNFLMRHQIHNVATVGEMGSNDQEGAKKYVSELRDELIERGLTPQKIVHILLNIDETGIVYKSVPKRTYKFINKTYNAKKSFKDRVTVLVGTSMDGFKLIPVVIGKARRPRALRGVNMADLPVHYYGQPSAWMSQEIMRHWFLTFLGPELKKHYGDDVQVILTIDNAGCHPPDLNQLLDYVEVKYLPPTPQQLYNQWIKGLFMYLK